MLISLPCERKRCLSARSPLASFSMVGLPQTSETGEGKAAASLCEYLVLPCSCYTGVGLVQPQSPALQSPSSVECSIVIVLQLGRKLVSEMLQSVVL